MDAQMLGLLTGAASGLEAAGPSRTPVSMGQILSRGLLSGMNAYQGAQDQEMKRGLLGAQIGAYQGQEELRRAQMEELKRKAAQEAALAQARAGIFGDPGISPQQALMGGGGPTNANAAMIRPPNPMAMNPAGVQRYLGMGGDPKVIESFQNLGPQGQLSKIDPKDYTSESFAQFMAGGGPAALRPRVKKDIALNGQVYDAYSVPDGTVFADPNKPFSLGPNGQSVPNTAYQNYETGRAAAGAARQTTIVNPALDPFKNEKALRDEFQSNPTVKAASEMDSAFRLIETAYRNPSPANDLAMATKYMKILDPTSVVRESELALAMSATGLIDKVKNYAEAIASGKKLNPNQRTDFYNSAKAINEAFQSHKGNLSNNYSRIASQYGLKPDNVTFNPQGPSVDDLVRQYANPQRP